MTRQAVTEGARSQQLTDRLSDPGPQLKCAGPEFVDQGRPSVDDADQAAKIVAEEVVTVPCPAPPRPAPQMPPAWLR